MRSLHDEHQRQAIHLVGVQVKVDGPAPACPRCGGPMGVQKTVKRNAATLAHGGLGIRETVWVCNSGCRVAGSNALSTLAPRVTSRSASLAQILPPRSVIGYDVMVHVGLERFVHHRQREEIRADLQSLHGIVLSTGEISRLGRCFLTYLEALHLRSAPALRAALEADGGWPLHIDATGEDGRGTLVAAFAGWRGWVLGAWKVPTERSEFILPGIQNVAAAFGTPCAIMRDLGPAMKEASGEFVLSLEKPVPVLACHLHFLADIGEDLLEVGHNQLRDFFRQAKVLPRLREFVRRQGRQLGTSIGQGRDGLKRWLAQSEHSHRIPDGVGGIATVRSLAQWVLDYRADGAGQGFPFDLPWLDLYCRCVQLNAAAQTFLREPPDDAKVKKSLEKLCRILGPVECDEPPFFSVGAALSKRADLFAELRVALRLHDKDATASTDPEVKKLNDVRSAVDTLAASLRLVRPQRGPAKDTRQAIDLILSHLERHGPYLWGHVIQIPESAGGGVRLVARTNNVLESFFHKIKHGERRRSGRKILTQDFERLPPAAALAMNLTHPDYVAIICGSFDRLPGAFAELDAANRSRSIAAGATDNNPTVETASLSTRDKRIVRVPALNDRIMAAAQCA